MSIAALKRKTLNGNPRLAPISGSNNGSFGFSLNGTRRNIGRVGVTNLAPGAQRGPTQMIESVPGNITNNNGIAGHSESCCTNDSNIVKPSVINTRGMLSRKLKCLPAQSEFRNCTNCTSGTNPESGCYNWVQPMNNGNIETHTQGEYINKVSTEAISKVSSGANCNSSSNTTTWPCVEGSPCYASSPFPDTLSSEEITQLGLCISKFVGSKKLYRGPYTKVLPANGQQAAGAAMPQSEYIKGRYLNKQCIPPDLNNKHFPPMVNNKGCTKIYMTKDAAIAAGLYN